jgi:ABC-2 type transport system permease protein
VKAYWSVVKARIRVLLQYRAAALAGLGTQLFWGLIRVMIFDAFYASSRGPQPMNHDQVITYLWLIQAMLLLLPFRIDTEIRAMMRSGTVAYELARPVDLYWIWFSRNLALRTAPALLRATPMFVVAGLFLGLRAPASLAAAVSWAVAVAGAVALSCAITTLMSISMLWTISGEGVAYLIGIFAMVLSGAIIPLPLFPDWAQPVLMALPFRGLMDIPFRLYTGHVPAGQVFPCLGHQLAWSAGLILLGRWVLSRGVRHLVVQGG